MKFSVLGFNQEEVLQFQQEVVDENSGKTKVSRVDVIDLLILQDIADFMNRSNIIKYVIDEKTFFCVKYNVIINDLPILNLKQQALSDRLKKLCDFGLLEKAVVKNQSGTYTAFRIGKAYEGILYNNGCYIENMENHSHKYLDTSAKVAEYKCNIYNINNNISNNNSSTINNKEEDTNVSPKKNDYQAIFDCWNKYNGKKIRKVTQFTDARKKAIKKMLDIHNISQEVLMRFFASLPFADQWLFHPTGTHKLWKPTFDWWMANTNGWLTKGLEGGVHLENPQAFERIMNSDSFSSTSALYFPQGRDIWFNEDTKSYWSTYNFYDERIYDGYTDEERPDGAEITLNNARGTYKWNSNNKKWERK